MWTDLKKNFTTCFVSKFSMYTSQRFLPHLQYVATLPCESRKIQKYYQIFTLNVTLNMFN